jgi:hypothetical protein
VYFIVACSPDAGGIANAVTMLLGYNKCLVSSGRDCALSPPLESASCAVWLMLYSQCDPDFCGSLISQRNALFSSGLVPALMEEVARHGLLKNSAKMPLLKPDYYNKGDVEWSRSLSLFRRHQISPSWVHLEAQRAPAVGSPAVSADEL